MAKVNARGQFTVPNDSPELFGFLEKARTGDTFLTLGVLADWLEELSDLRAGGIRDLLDATITISSDPPPPRIFCGLASGPGWESVRSLSIVRFRTLPGSRLTELLGRELSTEARLYPPEQAGTHAVNAIKDIRLDVVLTLFDTSSWGLFVRREINSSPVSDSLLDLLRRDCGKGPKIVASLAHTHPARFAELMLNCGRRPSLREFAEDVLSHLRGTSVS